MKRLGSLQFSFLFLNVLFWTVGIGIVGFVSWTLSSLPSSTEFLSVAFAFLYVILFLGLVIAATGLLGCLGGLFRGICLLKWYIGLMVAFVFIEVAITIGAYTQQDEIPSMITSTWPKLNNDTKFTLQEGLECCGVSNYTEYGLLLGDLPLSCFRVYDTLTVHTRSWTLLFRTPCLQQIENWFNTNLPIWVTVLILICIVQFVSMGLGVAVMVGIEERVKVHPAPDPPDDGHLEDGTTIACSESPHPQSSHVSEFSDQQSLSSDSGDTTTRKLSQVPEEEELEECMSSGVVCCDSKDDLSRSRTCSPEMQAAEEVKGTISGGEEREEKREEGEKEEKETPLQGGPDDEERGAENPSVMLVAYSEHSQRYENLKSPTVTESQTTAPNDNGPTRDITQKREETVSRQEDCQRVASVSSLQNSNQTTGAGDEAAGPDNQSKREDCPRDDVEPQNKKSTSLDHTEEAVMMSVQSDQTPNSGQEEDNIPNNLVEENRRHTEISQSYNNNIETDPNIPQENGREDRGQHDVVIEDREKGLSDEKTPRDSLPRESGSPSDPGSNDYTFQVSTESLPPPDSQVSSSLTLSKEKTFEVRKTKNSEADGQ